MKPGPTDEIPIVGQVPSRAAWEALLAAVPAHVRAGSYLVAEAVGAIERALAVRS